jgi:hypothetical protein
MKRLLALLCVVALAGFPISRAYADTVVNTGPSGLDHSGNPPSLSGLTLLATIAPNNNRKGYFVQAQCTAGLTVVFDDAAGSTTATVVVLGGAASNGAQGGSVNMAGMPHQGRIRIYSSSAGCQMASRVW